MLDLKVPVDESDHTTGADAEAARVTLVEYGDYECPSCAATQPHVEAVLKEHGEVVRFAFRHFPLTTVHPKASVAAQAAEAAGAQGKFWPMHRALYARPGGDASENLERLALRVGLEPYRFNSDLTGSRFAKKVALDVESGRESGVTGTPTFFLNGRRLELPAYEALADAVSHALEE